MRQVDVIRGNADKIMPWLSAQKNTGRRYTYEEILLNLGLPADKNMRRTLSKFVNGQGIRRRRLSHRKEKVIAEGVMTPAGFELDTEKGITKAKAWLEAIKPPTEAERFMDAWIAAGQAIIDYVTLITRR